MYFSTVPFAIVSKYEQMHVWTGNIGVTWKLGDLMPESESSPAQDLRDSLCSVIPYC